ncbi:uncharacterized protein K02A2.6-like [Trichonephila clavipes]|nr:uncharacterized protein K02A2.6-like [Trichonephila clavipes]
MSRATAPGLKVYSEKNTDDLKNHTSVKFAQILRPPDNANENFIITISDGSPTFDIGPNVSQHNKAEVEQLYRHTRPKKTKTVNIELDIALTDDEPIFHKPRRLPFAEREYSRRSS